jgi:hypothetical protein
VLGVPIFIGEAMTCQRESWFLFPKNRETPSPSDAMLLILCQKINGLTAGTPLSI